MSIRFCYYKQFTCLGGELASIHLKRNVKECQAYFFPLSGCNLFILQMWNKLIPSKDSPKISFFNQLEVQDLRYLHQVMVWRRLLWCPRVELLECSSSQSEHLWSKEKSYVLPAHTLNIQWQDKHRVTTINHPHPIQKRGKLKTQRSLQPIVKSIRANVESSLTKTQGLKNESSALSFSLWALGHSFFFVKGNPCFLLNSFLSLLPAYRSFMIQRPLVILYWLRPFQFKHVVVLPI